MGYDPSGDDKNVDRPVDVGCKIHKSAIGLESVELFQTRIAVLGNCCSSQMIVQRAYRHTVNRQHAIGNRVQELPLMPRVTVAGKTNFEMSGESRAF